MNKMPEYLRTAFTTGTGWAAIAVMATAISEALTTKNYASALGKLALAIGMITGRRAVGAASNGQ